MKRFWPLSVLLLLALSARAQEGDDAAGPVDAAPAAEAAPAPEEVKSEDVPPPDNGDAAEASPPQGGAGSNEGAADGEPAEKPSNEKSLISVKVVPSYTQDGEVDEESVTPAVPPRKVVPTATLMQAPKKGKAVKTAKNGKIQKAAPSPMKTKAPPVAPEPPPSPIPAVPLTPITPRNP